MGAGVREAALHRDRLGRPCGLCRHLLAKSRRSPGGGGEPLTFWPCVTQLLRVIHEQFGEREPIFDFPNLKIPIGIAVLLAEAGVKIDYEPDTRDPEFLFGLLAPFDKSFKATRDWAAPHPKPPTFGPRSSCVASPAS